MLQSRASRIAGLGVLLALACAPCRPARAGGAQPLVAGTSLPVPLGLARSRHVAMSPDGSFLYATGNDSVVTYAWDPGGPTLTAVSRVPDGSLGVTSFGRENTHILVSPDGAHAYLTGSSPGAVYVFSRDTVSGALTLSEFHTESTLPALDWATGSAISSDGAHLYVTGASGVVVFERDGGTGALTLVEVDPAGGTGQAILSPDDTHLYVLSGAVLTQFDRDGATGVLSVVASFSIGGARFFEMSPSGAHVYVCRVSDPTLHYARDLITGALTLIGDVPNSDGADQIHVRADGTAAVLTDATILPAAMNMRLLSRDPATGLVSDVDAAALDPTAHSVWSPDGSWVFNATEGIWAYEVTPTEITLVGQHEIPGNASTAQPTSTYREAAASPDGEHLYLAAEEVLIVYDRDPSTGEGSILDVLVGGFGGIDGLHDVRSLAVSPDGANVYVASAGTEIATPSISVFSRDPATGLLVFVEEEAGGPGVSTTSPGALLRISPDGNDVYVAGHQGVNLAHFTRDGATGALTYVGVVDGFVDAAEWFAISSDGLHVYLPGDVTGLPFKGQTTALHIYARDVSTGALTSVGQVEVPGDITGGAISPDGQHLYVTSSMSGLPGVSDVYRLFSYGRDSATGSLSLVDTETHGKGGVALGSKGRLIVSSDGSHVYTNDGTRSFVRDPFTGETAYIQLQNGGRFLLRDPTDAILYRDDPASTIVAASFDTAQIFYRGFQCSDEPRAGCRTAPTGNVQIVDKSKNKGDRVKWTWKRGEPTTHADFAPLAQHYAFCVYDSGGAPDRLILGSLLPANQKCGASQKPCWTDKIKKFIYKDPDKTPEGMSTVALQPSDEKPQIKVKAVGNDLGWRVATPLPPVLPVRVQLQSEAGICWEATYAAALKNDGTQFKSIAGIP